MLGLRIITRAHTQQNLEPAPGLSHKHHGTQLVLSALHVAVANYLPTVNALHSPLAAAVSLEAQLFHRPPGSVVPTHRQG